MLKSLIVNIIRRKNPDFKMDDVVSSKLILELALKKVIQKMRGARLLLSFRLPKQIYLGRSVQFFNLSNIKFGKWVQLEDYVYVSGLSKAPVEFGNNVRIGAFSQVIASTSFNEIGEFIKIGNNVGIGEFSYLGGAGGLEIGDDCIIGQFFSCHPENHKFEEPNKLIRLQGVERKGIQIGKNCWIGSKVTILDGVTIGDNCVIAAGAVVTKNMPSNSVIGGVPARVLRKDKGVKKKPIKKNLPELFASKNLNLN